MYTIMAEEMNKYMHRKEQTCEYLNIYTNVTLFTKPR